MNKPYESPVVRKNMYEQLSVLMKKAQEDIYNATPEARQYYTSEAHQYLNTEGWELLFSLEKENWPEEFSNMQRNYDKQMKWPFFTTYAYLMDVVAPPCIPHVLLHFGYAVYEEKLVRCTFFVVQKMVTYQSFAQGMVIDPLAEREGKIPSFYVGIPVLDKEKVFNWMRDRKNPFEQFVKNKNEKEHQERIQDSYIQAYWTQLTYEPKYFPPGLIEFAKKENLYIPEGQRNG